MATEAARRSDLYSKVGEALHLSQTLELRLSVFADLVSHRAGIGIDPEGFVAREYRETLGQLVRALRIVVAIDENGERLLADALKGRNYIVHHFFNRNVYAFSTEEVYGAAKADLFETTKAIAIGVAMTDGWFRAYCEAVGIDTRAILVKQNPVAGGLTE